MMRAYRTKAGVFIGQTDGNIPEGMVECPVPEHGMQKFSGGKWADTPELEKMRAKHALENTDIEMARLVEDILQVLKDKGVMNEADLPADAQAKLAARRENRGKM